MHTALTHRKALAFAAFAVAGSVVLAGCTSADGAEDAATLEPAVATPVAEAQEGLPNIVVVDADGTLTSTATDRISYQHYADPIEGGLETIVGDMYPELGSVANVSVVTADSMSWSSAVTSEILYNVSTLIQQQLDDPEVDGVVVTGGTNVLEEDAYFFDLTVQSPKPLVITGAMHQYGTFTYDGYTNVFSSIRLAASGETACYGTVMLLNDQFFAARDVTKTDGYRMDTMDSRGWGALGMVNEDVIRTMRAPARVMQCGTDEWATPFDLSTITAEDLATVDIVYGYVDASAETVSGLAGAADGIVTTGHGPGSMSLAQMGALDELDDDIVVVSTTRTGGEGTYSDPEAGVIGGGDLNAQKARILLQLGLTFSDDPAQIADWFATIGDPQFDMSDAL